MKLTSQPRKKKQINYFPNCGENNCIPDPSSLAVFTRSERDDLRTCPWMPVDTLQSFTRRCIHAAPCLRNAGTSPQSRLSPPPPPSGSLSIGCFHGGADPKIVLSPRLSSVRRRRPRDSVMQRVLSPRASLRFPLSIPRSPNSCPLHSAPLADCTKNRSGYNAGHRSVMLTVDEVDEPSGDAGKDDVMNIFR